MPADFILLENDRFAAFARLPGRPLLRLAWTDKTIELSHEQYKAIVRRWLELIAEHAADRLLIDTSAHTFTITPDLQTWFGEVVLPGYDRLGVRRVAFVLSRDLFTQVSIEQAMEEGGQERFQAAYFESEEQALRWLD